LLSHFVVRGHFAAILSLAMPRLFNLTATARANQAKKENKKGNMSRDEW
jgi:hypothetical protein